MALIEFKDGRPVEGSLEGVEVVEIPEGVEKIAERAFEWQTKIREIIIPDTEKILKIVLLDIANLWKNCIFQTV